MTTAWDVAGDPDLSSKSWRIGRRGRQVWEYMDVTAFDRVRFSRVDSDLVQYSVYVDPDQEVFPVEDPTS